MKLLASLFQILDLYVLCGGSFSKKNQTHCFPEKALSELIHFLKQVEKILTQKQRAKELGQTALGKNSQAEFWVKTLQFQQFRKKNSPYDAYQRFVYNLLEEQENFSPLAGKSLWQTYLLFCLSDSLLFKKLGVERQFLKARSVFFQHLLGLDLQALVDQIFAELNPEEKENWPYLKNRPFALYPSLPKEKAPYVNPEFLKLTKKIFSFFQEQQTETKPENFFSIWQNFWEKNTGGKISQFVAFRWKQRNSSFEKRGKIFFLQPWQPNSQLQFSKLLSFEHNHQALIENTEQFLNFDRIRHVLLWGDRGMGKTSSISALVNHFSSRGLKWVLLEKQQLENLPALWEELNLYKEKFLLTLDDLSFEPQDYRFYLLKTVLEGSFHFQKSNVLCIVTSNHRDLVVLDKHLDQSEPKDREILDEARALDDRFGLKLYYPSWQFEELKTNFLLCAKEKNISFPKPQAAFQEFMNFCRYNQQDLPSARAVQIFLSKWG